MYYKENINNFKREKIHFIYNLKSKEKKKITFYLIRVKKINLIEF